MKLGAQLYSVRDRLTTPEDIRETFKRIKSIGYENVQLSGNGPIAATELKSISESAGLPIVLTHSPWDRIINDTDALVAEHKTFDCDTIGLGYLPKEFQNTLKGIEEFLRLLEEPVKKIEAAGLYFAYHNHAFEFNIPEGADKCTLDILLGRFPKWRFTLDTYWVAFAGKSVVEYIAKAGRERLHNIHYKDMASDEKRSICSCGSGVLDFCEITSACMAVKTENVLVEQDNALFFEDEFAEMEKSFCHLRGIIK